MRWTCTGCGKEWRYLRHIWTFPYLYRVLFESIIWMGNFLSVFIAQVAEMRALKKEVHRQMQIHGDYKVGGTLSSNGHGGWAGIFRAGTTERTLPSMPGSRGRVMCSTQSRGWDGWRKFFLLVPVFYFFRARTLLAMTTLPNKRKAPPTDSLYSMKKPDNKHKGVYKNLHSLVMGEERFSWIEYL